MIEKNWVSGRPRFAAQGGSLRRKSCQLGILGARFAALGPSLRRKWGVPDLGFAPVCHLRRKYMACGANCTQVLRKALFSLFLDRILVLGCREHLASTL